MTDIPKVYDNSNVNSTNSFGSSINKIICDEWLKAKSITLKPLSYDKYENIVNKYLLPFFKEHSIDNLNESSINSYLNGLKRTGLSGEMIRVIKNTLREVYSFGETNYGLRHIDFTIINSSSTKKKKIEVLDENSERIVYDYCLTHIDSLGVSIMLCLYSGLRFSEICALKYSDLNLVEGFIDVSRKVQRNVNRSESAVKTQFHVINLYAPEKRKIMLNDQMVDYLKSYIPEYDVDCYLLSKKPVLKEQRKYQNMLKKLGEKHSFNLNYTILRNTCKNKCITYGVDINTMLSTLGLSRIEISIDETSKSSESLKKIEMKKIMPSKNENQL